MAASTVSKDSEGIYTDLASPYQDVYSTLGQTSLNSPGAQHTGRSGQSSHPYRRAAVCLGLLCALLLAATLVLCVLYTSLSGNYSMLERDLEEPRSNCSTMNKEKVHQQKNYSMLERDLEKLRTSCNTMKVQQQGKYSMLERDLDKLRTSCNTMKVQQQENYSMLERDLERLRTSCSTMNEEKVQQQRNYNAVFKKLPFLEQYCPSSSQSRVCEPCPQAWSQFSSKCYYFSTESKTWTDSRSDCIKRGADLVIIESEEEQWFITNITSKTPYHTWIGLSRSEFKSNWLWVDETPLQKGFWGSGKPAYQSRFDCAMIATKNNAWAAYYCSNNEQWICETNALLP